MKRKEFEALGVGFLLDDEVDQDPEVKERERKEKQKRMRIELAQNTSKTSSLSQPVHSKKITTPITSTSSSSEVSSSTSVNVAPSEEELEFLKKVLHTDEFDDTVLSLRRLRTLITQTHFHRQFLQVKQREKSMPPIILRHMLFSIISDRTQIDKTLDRLLFERKIRQIRLPATAGFYVPSPEKTAIKSRNAVLKDPHQKIDAICYVFTQDYLDSIKIITEDHLQKLQNQKNESEDSPMKKALQKLHDSKVLSDEQLLQQLPCIFETKIIPNCNDTYIQRQQLEEFTKCSEKQITLLIRLGLLVQKDIASFWFSVPNVGSFIQQLEDGRKELIAMLKRKKYKEMMLKDLEMKDLKKSSLGTDFHIKELLGSELCDVVHTSHGEMLSLKTGLLQ